MKVLYKNKPQTIFFKTLKKDLNSKDLKLFIYLNNEFREIPTIFQKLDDRYFQFNVNFTYTGKYFIKIMSNDMKIASSIINIEEDYIKELYDYQFGRWELQDNYIIFFGVDGKELAKFNIQEFIDKNVPDEEDKDIVQELDVRIDQTFTPDDTTGFGSMIY